MQEYANYFNIVAPLNEIQKNLLLKPEDYNDIPLINTGLKKLFTKNIINYPNIAILINYRSLVKRKEYGLINISEKTKQFHPDTNLRPFSSQLYALSSMPLLF